jgi:hypothetical protein
MNYRALFENNPVYCDPTGLLDKEEFYIYLLWMNGINQPDSSELLDLPLGSLKLKQCDMFNLLKTKLALRFDIDNRALIIASFDYGILTKENCKLPKEVTEWIIKNKLVKP